MASDEEEIRQLVGRWLEASKRGDVATVLSLMTDDVVFLVPGQPPMKGRAAFETAMKAQASPDGTRPAIEGRSEIQEIRVLHDWAFMWTKLEVEIQPPGRAWQKRAGHTLTVLRKDNGAWRIARDANLLAPAT